ncbi:Neurofibromin 1 [Homalodisca vitripennis]|nr:Neurofibromin 1 [Homalodisca vitripennis]
MNLLNDCTDVTTDIEGKDTGRQRLNASKLNTLRNATIQAMSNLLSANIDSGLMHSIDLGYNPDLQTRAAFMEVLTKILQQGTEFDTLAETVLADRFEQLVQLVTMISDKGELPIAMALANVVTTSQMVTVVVADGYPPVEDLYEHNVGCKNEVNTKLKDIPVRRIKEVIFKIGGSGCYHVIYCEAQPRSHEQGSPVLVAQEKKRRADYALVDVVVREPDHQTRCDTVAHELPTAVQAHQQSDDHETNGTKIFQPSILSDHKSRHKWQLYISFIVFTHIF